MSLFCYTYAKRFTTSTSQSGGSSMQATQKNVLQRLWVWCLQRSALGALVVSTEVVTLIWFLAVLLIRSRNYSETSMLVVSMIFFAAYVVVFAFVYVPQWEKYHKVQKPLRGSDEELS